MLNIFVKSKYTKRLLFCIIRMMDYWTNITGVLMFKKNFSKHWPFEWVYHFGTDWNETTTIGWISIDFHKMLGILCEFVC